MAFSSRSFSSLSFSSLVVVVVVALAVVVVVVVVVVVASGAREWQCPHASETSGAARHAGRRLGMQ